MTFYSTAHIEHAMAAIKGYIDSEMEHSAKSVMGRTSGFWKVEFAARPNYPTVSDYLAFRREGFTHGMADGFSFDLASGRALSLAAEEGHATRTYEIFRQSADPARVAALDEAALGAPFVFKHAGANRSASFWTNAITALRVKDILAARGPIGRSLDMLEIGAGWGCMAQQVHQLLDINSYTIVDLPQNLFLSATYVAATTKRRLLFATGTEKSVNADRGSLLCALPGAVPSIAQKYDVVVNSFSLQEMDLETVQAYLAWIGQALKEDGVFISFNSHGKAGVAAPSDYPLEYFHLDHLGMFRAFPSGLMNTVPYEMALSPRKGRGSPDPEMLNVICCLLQFGLGDDLKPICSAFTTGALREETATALRALTNYFSTDRIARAAALEYSAAGLPPAVHAYLRALDAFAREDWQKARPLLEEALQAGLKGFARLRACTKLAILTKSRTLAGWSEDFDARLAYPELAQMLDKADPNPFIVQFDRIVSVDLPVKALPAA
jgi:putative sugar O-methyltransferase